LGALPAIPKEPKFLADFERKKKLAAEEWADRERTLRLIEIYNQAFGKGGRGAADRALKEEFDRMYPKTKPS
jgi:hypothetical protein